MICLVCGLLLITERVAHRRETLSHSLGAPASSGPFSRGSSGPEASAHAHVRIGPGAGWIQPDCDSEPKPHIQLTGELVELRGPLMRELVERMIRVNYGYVLRCVEKVFPHPDEGPLGGVSVALTIAADGHVRGVRSVESTPPALGACVVRSLDRILSFPRAPATTSFVYAWRVSYGVSQEHIKECEQYERWLTLPPG